MYIHIYIYIYISPYIRVCAWVYIHLFLTFLKIKRWAPFYKSFRNRTSQEV